MAVAARTLETQFRLLDLRPPRLLPVVLREPLPAELPAGKSRQSEEVSRLRSTLAGTAAAHVTNATELIRALEKQSREESIPTTLSPFDQLLGGGLPRGRLVELTGRRGAGRFSIAMSALAAATSIGEAAVLIDLGDHFDPQFADAEGVDLRRLLWIRPKTLKQAVMSAEMITATGFQLVVLDTGLHPIRSRRVPDAAWVRLARAAEAHGTALLVTSPYPLSGTASEAVIALENGRARWLVRSGSPRLLTGMTTALRLEKHRHRKAGEETKLILEMLP